MLGNHAPSLPCTAVQSFTFCFNASTATTEYLTALSHSSLLYFGIPIRNTASCVFADLRIRYPHSSPSLDRTQALSYRWISHGRSTNGRFSTVLAIFLFCVSTATVEARKIGFIMFPKPLALPSPIFLRLFQVTIHPPRFP